MPDTKPSLTPWWPITNAGQGALVVFLLLCLAVPLLKGDAPAGMLVIGGFINMAVWYGIIMTIRYFVVVQPDRRKDNR